MLDLKRIAEELLENFDDDKNDDALKTIIMEANEKELIHLMLDNNMISPEDLIRVVAPEFHDLISGLEQLRSQLAASENENRKLRNAIKVHDDMFAKIHMSAAALREAFPDEESNCPPAVLEILRYLKGEKV